MQLRFGTFILTTVTQPALRYLSYIAICNQYKKTIIAQDGVLIVTFRTSFSEYVARYTPVFLI